MKKNHDRRSPNARILRLENLETRELLSVTTAELGPVASNAVADATLPDAPIPLGALVVDTTLDVVDPSDGVLSLREAIQNANDGDTIAFDSSLAGETITLSGTQLEIDKAIAIDASALSTDGSPAITIDANRQSRVLYVHADAQSSGVALKGLTIANGLVDGLGGGIMVDSTGDLTIDNCVVSKNKANIGAGVCSVNGKVVANNVDFIGNVASSQGGGLYLGDGAETESGSLSQATVELDSCNFSNNASSDGGAILNKEGTLSAYNCVFSTNTGSNGAGVTVLAGLGSFEDSSFSGNTSRNTGGAISVKTGATVDATNCEFVDNTAKYNGGAIFNSASNFSAEDSSFARNAAKEGSALYNTLSGAVLSLTNVTIANNTATTYGGGISARYGNVTLTACTIADNQADRGGALFLGGNGTAIVEKSDFSGNSAKTSGGAIWSAGAITLDHSSVTKNSSSEGGAIKLETATAPIVVKDSLLAGNKATNGGAIYSASPKVTAYFYNTTIGNNTASSNGAGISCAGTFNFYNTIVAGNFVPSSTYNQDVVRLSYDNTTLTGYNTLSRVTKWDAGSDNLRYDASKPLFVNTANGDYNLASESQAIAKGNVDYVVSDYDLAGESRSKDATVDLGAYVYKAPEVRAFTLKTYNRSSRQAVMEWDAIPDAATYRFKISKDGGKTWITYAKNFTNTYKSVNGIYAGKSYSFRVYGVDANGKSLGTYLERTIEPFSISSMDKPYVVNAGRPVALQAYDPTAVSIRWYQVTDSGLVELEDASYKTTYAPNNKQYELKVVATGRDGTNAEGFVSELYIGRPTRTINFTAQNAAATSLNASWEEVPGAASYLVKVSKDGGETWITKKKDIASNTVLLTSVADGYQFRVYAFDADGRQMKSIAQSTFDLSTIPTKDDPLVFTNVNKSKTAATLTWLPINGAVTYKILVSRDNGVTWITKKKDLTDTTASLSDINETNPFRICGYDKSGSRLDAYYQASLNGLSLSNPIVFTDVNADQTEANLRWIPIDGAATYKIRVSKDGGATWVDQYSKFDYPHHILRGIESGYQFRVYGYDSAGNRVSGSLEITFQPSSASLLDEAFADYFAEDELFVEV